jgi:uncharacterized coiled-coil protein SlyX
MKAYFRHLDWVISTQDRISRLESNVAARDRTISNLKGEIIELQKLLHLSTSEKMEIADKLRHFTHPDES